MLVFGIIGILVLVLIFLVLRLQNANREVQKLKFSLRSLQNQTRYTLGALLTMSKQLQYNYKLKLDGLRHHGLLHGDDLLAAQFLIDNFVVVVTQCCERNASVEEALKKALEGSPFSMARIQQFVASQAVEVRVPWSKNNLEGFMSACNNMVSGKLKTQSSAEEQTSS
ncbi:MAG: hypothetical protein GW763_01650 [Paraglaciecola sp.]|nr:hypothetical protein [Paraglaciecola sp.]NCT46693.1 hypothetical protein [Paraglaciecola sp.]